MLSKLVKVFNISTKSLPLNSTISPIIIGCAKKFPSIASSFPTLVIIVFVDQSKATKPVILFALFIEPPIA